MTGWRGRLVTARVGGSLGVLLHLCWCAGWQPRPARLAGARQVLSVSFLSGSAVPVRGHWLERAGFGWGIFFCLPLLAFLGFWLLQL